MGRTATSRTGADRTTTGRTATDRPTRRPSWSPVFPRSEDVALAVVLGVVSLLGTSVADPDTSLASYVLIAGLFVPLVWRSARPITVALLVSVAAAAVWFVTRDDMHTAAAGAVALYGLGRRVERPGSIRWFVGVFVGLVAAAGIQVVVAQGDQHEGWFPVVARGSLILGAFWFGDAQQQRDRLLDTMRDRADRAEEHRRVVEQQAVQEERNRIARELHDVVAHSLSVMVVQATAAIRLADHDTDRSHEAMRSVADVGRTAMGEMRQILGLLDGGQERVPQPGLSDLDPLVDRYRSSGLDVTVRRADDLPQLGTVLELAAVRVIQEGLTNALKHAPGTTVTVSLTRRTAAGRGGVDVDLDGEDQLEVVVADTGSPDPASPPAVPPMSSGRGLVGMGQRVESLGGTLVTGPGPDGGFVVTARLPLDGTGLDGTELDGTGSRGRRGGAGEGRP